MNLFKKIKEAEAAAPVTKRSFTRSIAMTALLLTVLTVAVTAYITTAWFASNRQLEGDGALVDVQASSNLIITKAYEQGASVTDKTFNQFRSLSATENSVTFTSSNLKLAPATHSASHATGLKTIDDNSYVGSESGLNAAGHDYTWMLAENADGVYYYKDYVVRIASSGQALQTSGLTVTLSSEDGLGNTPATQYQKAASVDFYVMEGSENAFLNPFDIDDYTLSFGQGGTYKGTLNLAGLDAAANNGSTLCTSVTLAGDTVPWNGQTGDNACCYIVLMRFYFDGGLLTAGNTGTAYVHTANLLASDFSMSVAFSAPEPAASP